MNARSFFSELKRRRVYSVAVAYVVVAWLFIQVATQVFPFFSIPNWVVRLIVLLTIIGFPIAVVCAWAFEVTSEGIKLEGDVDRGITRKTGRKLTALIVIVAAVAAGVTVFRFLHSQQVIDSRSEANVWAQTYDRDLADVFAIQSEIAKAIAGQLQAKLSPNEKSAIDRRPTADLLAFDQYSLAKTLLLTTGASLSQNKN